MRALTFHGVHEVRLESVADPGLQSAGDAIVKVELTAICGSDLHVYHGRERGLDAGTVLGHEFLGEVVEVGSDVTGLCVGDRVVSPFSTSCGDCFYCRDGLTARCERGALFGWVEGKSGLHGAQAEYVRVPLATTTLVGVPERVRAEEALLAGDVLSTGFFCADMAGVTSGSVVAVVGCGPVGIMAIVAARHLGAERVLALDRVAERLELARTFGAEPVDVTSDDVVDAVRAATGGRGVDAVLEVVGSPQATRLAVDIVRPGGTIAAAGVHTEPQFAFAPSEAYDKNLTYRAGRCSARHYMPRVMPLLVSGKHDLARIFSHRMTLEQGVESYAMFADKRDGCTKVVLCP